MYEEIKSAEPVILLGIYLKFCRRKSSYFLESIIYFFLKSKTMYNNIRRIV